MNNNEYHGDVNYGNRFPKDWYDIRPEYSIKTEEDRKEHARIYGYEYKPLPRKVNNWIDQSYHQY